MENYENIRKVAKCVMFHTWFKEGILKKVPPQETSLVPEITNNLMNKLHVLVCIEILYISSKWRQFSKTHIERMTTSSWFFSIYVSHACYLQNEDVDDVHEGFIRTLALVTYFGFYCLRKDFNYLLDVCPDLFSSFFEKELQTKYESQGNAMNLKVFLDKLSNLPSSLSEAMESLSKFGKYHTNFPEIKLFNQGDIPQSLVESHVNATNFADSIKDKITKLGGKTCDDVLAYLEQSNSDVEAFPQQECEEMSLSQHLADIKKIMEYEAEKLFTQEVKTEDLENVHDLTKPTREEDSPSISGSLETGDKLQGLVEPAQKSGLKPPLNIGDQVEELPRQKPGEISLVQHFAGIKGMIECEVEKLYPQEEVKGGASGNEHNLTTRAKDTSKTSDFLETGDKLQDSAEPAQTYLKPPLTIRDQIEKLLKDITADIDKLSNLIKSACETSALSSQTT